MTVFQQIIDGEIPADIVYEDADCVAFRDINPQAPVHVLVVPRFPLENVASATSEHKDLLGAVLLAAGEVARSLGVAGNGYRLVFNNGPDGGQTVDHLHCHVLGGRQLAQSG